MTIKGNGRGTASWIKALWVGGRGKRLWIRDSRRWKEDGLVDYGFMGRSSEGDRALGYGVGRVVVWCQEGGWHFAQ